MCAGEGGGGEGGGPKDICLCQGEPGNRGLFSVILVWENNKLSFSREAPFPLDPRIILIRHLDKIYVIPQSSDKGK